MKKSLPVLLSAVLIGFSRLPLHLGWLGFVGLIPLLFYFDEGKKNWKELLRDAFIYSAVNLTIWLHWIWSVTAGGYVGIILFYGIYFFLAFAAIQLIWRKLPRLKYLGFILVFLAVEYLQNFTEFRFPWMDLGYALTDYTVLLQAADIGGTNLLSLFLLMINVFLFQVMHRKWSYFGWIAFLMVLWTGYGIWCMKTLKLTRVENRTSIMQPSIPQEEKWEERHFEELYQRYVTLTEQAALDSMHLIIWPEAAMPAYILRAPDYRALVQNLCNEYNIEIFTGFPDILPAPESYPGGSYYYNAATLFKPFQRHDDPYYKIILVPVGERIPALKVFPFLWKLQFGQANWEYGPSPKYYESEKLIFSPQICFEIAFAELNRKMVFRNLGNHTKGKPNRIDFLVSITNDAWFGRSAGPWIHGMMTKFRAVENRIQIYRCANTGISMVVDPLGRILVRTKLFEIRNITAPLYKASRIPLFYYLYAWPRLACLLLLLLLFKTLVIDSIPFLKPRGQA
jgi:apolipoprotein N-acyltransferase